MTCRACGAEIADKAIVCYRCGAPTAESGLPRAPVRRAWPVGVRVAAVGLVLMLAVVVWVAPWTPSSAVVRWSLWAALVVAAAGAIAGFRRR